MKELVVGFSIRLRRSPFLQPPSLLSRRGSGKWIVDDEVGIKYNGGRFSSLVGIRSSDAERVARSPGTPSRTGTGLTSVD